MQLRLPLLSPIATLPGRKERGMNKEDFGTTHGQKTIRKFALPTIEVLEVVTFLASCREALGTECIGLNVRMNDK